MNRKTRELADLWNWALNCMLVVELGAACLAEDSVYEICELLKKCLGIYQ